MGKYNLISEEKFLEKIDKLYSILSNCSLCGHRCGVNRNSEKKGICEVGSRLKIASWGLHYGEEKVISGYNGSGTIFFSSCNLKCVYCQNYEISHLKEGYEISEQQLAEIMLELQSQKANNINFVSPTHFLPQIIRALYLARKQGLNIPIVYNTGGYDNPEVIKLLEGIVDIYMPDMKYSDDENAFKYSLAKNYCDINKKSVKEMFLQVGNLKFKGNMALSGLLIRHLVLPHDVSGSKKIIDFIVEELSKEVYLNIMAQYTPHYKARYFQEINRKITYQEYNEVVKYTIYKGMKNIDIEQMSLVSL